MSFIHSIRVGFFTNDPPAPGQRDLTLDECTRLVSEYNRIADRDLALDAVPTPRGNVNRGVTIAYAEDRPIVFKNGTLTCPYLCTSYIASSIAFAAFVKLSTGCLIYCDGHDRFLTVEELVPTEPFSSVVRQVAMRLGFDDLESNLRE